MWTAMVTMMEVNRVDSSDVCKCTFTVLAVCFKFLPSLSGALDKKEQFLQPTCYCTNLRNGTESVQYGIFLCYGKKSDVIVGSCCLSILLRTFPSNGKNAY